MMICGTCREEVRFGYRETTPGWWHRGVVDHDGAPVVPPEVVEVVEIPGPEQRAVDVDIDSFEGRSGMGQLRNLLRKSGWEIRSCKQSRGPYIGAKGEVLSISDLLVIKGRSPVLLDGSRRFVVALWRDGSRLDPGYIGTVLDREIRPTPANATEMKDWIKTCESDSTSTSTETESPPTLFEPPTT